MLPATAIALYRVGQ
jgi:hypothetical protein